MAKRKGGKTEWPPHLEFYHHDQWAMRGDPDPWVAHRRFLAAREVCADEHGRPAEDVFDVILGGPE